MRTKEPGFSRCVYAMCGVIWHISATSEAITIKFDKVTASVMRMHHISIFSSLHLDLWAHNHVLHDTGQCMLSEWAFSVQMSE